MKTLRRADDRGGINILIVPLILLLFLFLGAGAFGLWAYSGQQDATTNLDAKIAEAVQVAKEEESIAKDKQHAEVDKQPLKTYVGPEQFGSLRVTYPKTWSGYVLDTGVGGQPIDAFFQPGVVPNITDQASTFALRIKLVNQSYSAVTTTFNGSVTSKKLTASAYALPRVPSVVGIRYEGEIDASKKISGSMIVLPLRDKTLQIWTESPTYAADFNTHILPNLTFAP